MKTNIIRLTFLVLLFTPYIVQGQLYGKTIYSGEKITQKYLHWDFFACCQMKYQYEQCYWVTRFLNEFNRDTSVVDCCEKNLATTKNYRCISAYISRDQAPFYLTDIVRINPRPTFWQIKSTKDRFDPVFFRGPYLAYNGVEDHWIIVFGVEYKINYWKERTISVYYVDPRDGSPKEDNYLATGNPPIEVLYPL